MGRNDWEDVDDDLAALTGRPRGKISVKRILPQLLGIVGLTFVVAYYVPMHRAHRGLTTQHAAALHRGEELNRDLRQARSELESARERGDVLAKKVDEADSRAKKRADELSSLRERLGGALAKPVKTGAVRVAAAERGAVVSFADHQVFLPNKLDVSPKGKDLICDVARAAGDGELNVSGTARAGELAPPALRATLRNGWALGAAKAAAVLDTLEKGCRVPVSRLRNAGPSAHGEAKDASIHIEIPVSAGE